MNKEKTYSSLNILFWVLSIYWNISKVQTIIYIFSYVINMCRALFRILVLGYIIDQIIKISSTNDSNINDLFTLIAFLTISNIILSVIEEAFNYTMRMFDSHLSYYPKIMLYNKLNKLSIRELEKPELANNIQRFTETQSSIFSLVGIYCMLIGNIINILTGVFLLTTKIPLAIILLFILSTFKFIVNNRFLQSIFKFNKENTEEKRKANDMAYFSLVPSTFKEVKLTNAFGYIDNIFQNHYKNLISKMTGFRNQQVSSSIFIILIDYLIQGFAIFQLIELSTKGEVSIGFISIAIYNLMALSNSIGATVYNISNIKDTSNKIADIRSIFDIKEEKFSGLDLSGDIPTIEFKSVYFKYDSSPDYIIRNLNLKIKPGEKIALVGENGAGKTTLIKLLNKTYKVTKGEILINGININKLNSESWYKKIGTLFQDFNMYQPLTPRENILMGNISEIDENKIIKAAIDADAHNFIEKYPNKYDQILSESYKTGIRPSGGQWQKIAIARFFYRNSPILVLDEPTAAIDAIAEANIFNRIYEFIENKTVIIVSHRFSTVRNADRILVLADGEIKEEGSHSELLKLKGIYANSFSTQAKGYE